MLYPRFSPAISDQPSNENKISCHRQERVSQNRYALIIREICSRHVVQGPCEHVVCAVSQKRLPVVMCHASAFQSRDCRQSHVCVVCAWLNVGELPRFDNEPQHSAALSLIWLITCDDSCRYLRSRATACIECQMFRSDPYSVRLHRLVLFGKMLGLRSLISIRDLFQNLRR
jgi:hypothetical protein